MTCELRIMVLAVALVVAAGGCDDGGSGGGEASCTSLCEWDDRCGATDGTGPAPRSWRTSPAPIDDHESGGVGGACVDDCVADFRESSCLRSTLPSCAACLETNGCETRPCLEACAAVDDCLSRDRGEPRDPPASADR